MKEETGRHLPVLDGWRGLAIAVVLLGHFWLNPFIPGLSGFGVTLFFALSGRLMAQILFVRRSDLPTFFVRRLARVYPALLVFVLVTTMAFQATPYRHGIVAALLALTFAVNYAMVLTHPIALLDHLWSLCVEEHGYLVLALVAWFVRRGGASSIRVAAIVAGLGGAAVINGAISAGLLHQGYFTLLWRSDIQVAPIFLSAALHLAARDRTWLQRPWLAPTALAGAFALRMTTIPMLYLTAGPVLIAVAIASVDHAAAWIRRTLEVAPLRRLGLWSFSLYLWQQPFYKMDRDGLFPTPLLIVLAVAAALLSFYLVERPARSAINAAFRRRSERPARTTL